MNLITAFEVLKYSPAGSDYPTAAFCDLIPQIEQEFTRECLKKELYEYFVSKLTVYPAGVSEYDSGETYAQGDVVIRNGCLFVSAENSNASDPLAETGAWEAFERFTDAGVNELWKTYLRRILALKVYMSSLIYTTWRAGSGGITIAQGDGAGMRSANKGEISDVKRSLLAEIERTTANMREWLNDNWKAKGFPNDGVCGNTCKTPGKTSRRWMFKY